MPQKNPSLYDFRAPLPHVRECIRGLFGTGKNDMCLGLQEDGVVLDPGGKAVGISAVYYHDGKALPFTARFHLALTSLPGGTRVELRTSDPAVLLGSPAMPHPVPATSIEEYRILLRIGDCLGEKGMPLLILPNAQ